MSEPTADVAVDIDPLQTDEQLFAAYLETTAALKRIHQELQQLDTRRAAILQDSAGGDIDQRIKALDALEGPKSELMLRQAHLRNRWLLLSDQVHGVQARGRGHHINEIQEQIATVEARERDVQAEIADLSTRLEEATAQLEPLNVQRRALVRQAVELEAQTTKRVRINVRTADPFKIPAGVLIKGSVWAQCVEDGRAAGVDAFDIVVNEVLGEIVASSLDDE
jgi:chromosome segregation ATPase